MMTIGTTTQKATHHQQQHLVAKCFHFLSPVTIHFCRQMDISNILDTYQYRQSGWSKSQIGDVPYFELTLAFSVFMFALEYYLEMRQLGNFRAAKEVPKELTGSGITQETFKKSNDYQKDKFSFGLVSSLFMFLEGIALVFLGYLPFAWDFGRTQSLKYGLVSESNSALYQEMVSTALFVIFLMAHDTLVGLPFSLYSTFVVEQKHGFNKSTLALFFKDKLMTLALTVVLGSPVIAGIVWLIRLGGPHFYFYVWLFLCVVSIIMMTIYPTLIAPLFNKYTKLDEGPLYDAIAEVAKKVSFPLAQIYTVDGSKRSGHSNAYFYGFFKNKRIVLYDTLMKQVTQEELLAILGHEIGHWKLWHTIQGFVITQAYVFTLFLAFSYVQNTPGMFAAFGFHFTDPAVAPMPVFVGLMLFSQTFWTPVDKFLTLLLNFNSRRNEFAADAFAMGLGYANELSSGLIKISVENLGNMVPDPLYSAYTFSHPPLVERLRAMQTSTKKNT